MICTAHMRRLLSHYETFLQQQDVLKQQFVSLAQDGRQKAAEGRTTLEEVQAVLGPEL